MLQSLTPLHSLDPLLENTNPKQKPKLKYLGETVGDDGACSATAHNDEVEL